MKWTLRMFQGTRGPAWPMGIVGTASIPSKERYLFTRMSASKTPSTFAPGKNSVERHIPQCASCESISADVALETYKSERPSGCGDSGLVISLYIVPLILNNLLSLLVGCLCQSLECPTLPFTYSTMGFPNFFEHFNTGSRWKTLWV
jgi:hypothetical protein